MTKARRLGDGDWRVYACLDGDGGDDGQHHYFRTRDAAEEFIADAINPVEGWCLEKRVGARWREIARDNVGAVERDLS